MPRPTAPLLVVVAALVAGCVADPVPTPAPGTTAPGDASAPAGESPAVTPSAAGSAAATRPITPISESPPPIQLEMVTGGLVDPISVEGAPNGWLLVNERRGRVVAVDPRSGQTAVTLDIDDRVLGGGERGLLGLALHPDWPDTPRAFLHYSGEPDGRTVLSEMTGSQGDGGAPVLDPASEQVLLEVPQPFANHNGGQLAFGPDGHLYLGLGDGGRAGDPLNSGQDPATLLGAILRLDVSTPGDVAAPPDNPFVDGGGAPEVYLYGLRNPWRFSFDGETLWIADVGQNAFEEINRIDAAIAAGANLGWNVMEASHCFLDAGCLSEGLTLPLAEYGRDAGCSVSGGYVYRGEQISDLRGWYLAGDYCPPGPIFAVSSKAEGPPDAPVVVPQTLLESGLSISAFGMGADGTLYVADIGGGGLYRIVAAP